MSEPEKGKWSVIVKCTVIKELLCEDCVREEAWTEPFRFATDEDTKEMKHYEVISVEKAD